MVKSPERVILHQLQDLRGIATAGFAIGLHLRFMAPTYMFLAYPDGWVEEYGRDGLMVMDPAVAWAVRNTGPVRWSDLSGPDEAKVFERAARHGLRFGTMLSVVGEGSRSIGGFARTDREFTASELDELEARVRVLHEATILGKALAPKLREDLRRLSVTSTQP